MSRITTSKVAAGDAEDWLLTSGAYPEWEWWTVQCESGWDPSAESSGWDDYYGWYDYMGLAQFDAETWQAGEARFGIYGSPYDGVAAVQMMDAYFQAGESWRWPVCSR